MMPTIERSNRPESARAHPTEVGPPPLGRAPTEVSGLVTKNRQIRTTKSFTLSSRFSRRFYK